MYIIRNKVNKGRGLKKFYHEQTQTNTNIKIKSKYKFVSLVWFVVKNLELRT